MRPSIQQKKQRKYVPILAFLGLYTYLAFTRLGGFTLEDLPRSVYGLMTLQFEHLHPNVGAMAFDIAVIALGGTLFWLAFFAQFVLPTQSMRDRISSIARLFSLLLGGRGPAIFIHNGRIIEAKQHKKRKGAGVILLDTASAAVLHDKSSFTRAVGPGLVFTKRGEKIAGTVDLHTQERRLGPLPNENPFEEQAKKESDKDYRARQKRRLQTSGLSRDGVEVVPNIVAVFRLEAEPTEGGTQFGYNPTSVWRAVAHEAIVPDADDGGSIRRVSWEWLPTQIAADVWREYLRKYTLNELFDYSEAKSSVEPSEVTPTVLEHIIQMINLRMKKAIVEEYDDLGKRTGRRIPSREYVSIRERGIKVIQVRVNNIRLEKDPIEKRLVEQWKNTWLDRAKMEEELIRREREVEKYKGQVAALSEFADRASLTLYKHIAHPQGTTDQPETAAQSLEHLVQGTIDGILADPVHHERLASEEQDLREIIEWLRKQ